MINEIQELIKRNLKDFLIKFIQLIYTKKEIDSMFPNIEVLKNINKNKDNKLTYNNSILYTEEDINNLNIKASQVIVEIKDNDEITTKTLQEVLDDIIANGIQPTTTKSICGEAVCGMTICGSDEVVTKAVCGDAICGCTTCGDL